MPDNEEDAVAALHGLAQQDLGSLKTYLPVIIDAVDTTTDTCEISRREDDKQLAKNVPLAGSFKSAGAGEYHPLDPPEEGYVLVPSVPEEELNQRNGHTEVTQHRHHDLKDSHVVARRHYEGDDIPAHDAGDYLYYHPSGTFITIAEDTGAFVVQHASGNRVRGDGTEVAAETADGTRQVAVSEEGLRGEVTRADGETIGFDADESGVEFAAPDDYADRPANARSRLTLATDGTVTVDGIATVGDADAHREDPTTLNPDPADPRTYVETAEANAPIGDPTTASTAYRNAPAARLPGPLDAGGYEVRNASLPRREADPDLSVTDPTDPAYFRADEIPVGYMWVNYTDMVLRVWGSRDTPVDIQPL